MSKLDTARLELKERKKSLDEIPNEVLTALIKQDRGMQGDISILQIDPEENKVQAYVKEFEDEFWYSFEEGEFKLFSCTYEIKRPTTAN